MTKKINKLISEELPFYKEIRASWITNQCHCDESSPSKRKSFISKGIKFAPEWIGELGLVRYYLFHIDNNYIPGQSILKRIDKNKGFSPENCIIVERKKKNDKLIPKIDERESHIIIITDNTGEIFKDLLKNLSNKKLKRA